MNAWDRFQRWCGRKNNKPILRLLSIVVAGSTYYISGGSLWATFCALVIWLALTR